MSETDTPRTLALARLSTSGLVSGVGKNDYPLVNTARKRATATDAVPGGHGSVVTPPHDRDESLILPFPSGKVKCRTRLGEFLKHYHRAA